VGNPAFDALVKQARGGVSGVATVAGTAPAAGAAPSKAKPALETVDMAPIYFFDSWHRKPDGVVKVGLRFVSEGVARKSAVGATRLAFASHPNGDELVERRDMRGSITMTGILARACVMADDRTSLFFGTCPEDEIPEALTGDGIRRLWEAYEIFAKTHSIVGEEADDEDVEELSELLTPERVCALIASRERRVRRLIPLLLAELR
jgi:hypothetical protein